MSISVNNRLRPCPYCGGVAKVHHMTKYGEPKDPNIYLVSQVKCSICGAATRVVDDRKDNTDEGVAENDKKAISLWNMIPS